MNDLTNKELSDDEKTQRLAMLRELSAEWLSLLDSDRLDDAEQFMRGIERRVSKWDQEKSMAQEIRDWVDEAEGSFRLQDIYTHLQLSTQVDKKNAWAVCNRLVTDEILEKVKTRAGMYRKVDGESLPMDWANAPTNPLEVIWPFQLEKMVDIYPGNVIVVAGESNKGKTAFLLNTVKMNMDKHDIYYFNSEMGDSELRLRLSKFEGVTLEHWNFQAFERSDNYQDVIRPDAINIIDYLEVEESWRVSNVLKEIDGQLQQGIAIVALQKPRGRDVGYGGEPTLNRPRLYLSISSNTIKIVKAKCFRESDKNPNGKIMRFKLINGSEFIPQGEWMYPEDNPSNWKR